MGFREDSFSVVNVLIDITVSFKYHVYLKNRSQDAVHVVSILLFPVLTLRLKQY